MKCPVLTWTAATATGWLIGVALVLLLSALVESLHFGNLFYVGLGMGFAVGLAQWFVARRWFGATTRWIWASALGITAPFVAADILRLSEPGLVTMSALAGVGGLLSGLLQLAPLRPSATRAILWIVASAVAWICPAVLIFLLIVPGRPHSLVEFLRNFATILLGGIPCGLISGSALSQLVGTPPGT